MRKRKVEVNDDALVGMTAICEYMGKSKGTMLRLIRESDFPAVKIGQEWFSDRDMIAEWRKKIIAENKKIEKTLDISIKK
jgi:predicted DNA-binding transcriptional regulator AlpA